MARREQTDFIAFVEASRPALRRTAYLMCGDWHRAADITQEALIRVYVAWPRLDQDRGLRAYARRAVVNVAVEQSRKRSSREVPAADPRDHSADDPTEQVADRLFLLAALAELPARQRACVVLRFYEDLSVAAVAEALGCRTGTVKSQTARGLAALRTAYAAHGDTLLTPQPAHHPGSATPPGRSRPRATPPQAPSRPAVGIRPGDTPPGEGQSRRATS